MENYLQVQQNTPHLSKVQSSYNNEYYYAQYKKVYELSLTLTHHLQRNNQRQAELIDTVKTFNDKIENLRDPIRKTGPQKKRKFRRPADEIDKQFTCEVETCLKQYATVTSLKIHQRTKHPHLYPSNDHQSLILSPHPNQTTMGGLPNNQSQIIASSISRIVYDPIYE